MTPAHPTSSPDNFFLIPITTNTQVLLSHNYQKIKENLFHNSWKFTYTVVNRTYNQQVQEINTNLSHNMNKLASRALCINFIANKNESEILKAVILHLHYVILLKWIYQSFTKHYPNLTISSTL